MIEFERCVTGRLRDAYPSHAHDVEIRLAEDLPPDRLTQVLGQAARAALDSDPRCRRVVFAAPAGDTATIAATEAAGFRYVLDVDLAGIELSLLVAEPGWVTVLDSDRVPGT